MRTIKTILYEFDELSDKAKKKAIEHFGQWWHEDFDGDGIKYLWKTKLEELGYKNADIKFSGFDSQGDGACFNSNIEFDHKQSLALLPCDLKTKINIHNAKCRLHSTVETLDLSMYGQIVTSGNYYHSGTMQLGEFTIHPDRWHRCNLGPCDCVPTWLGVCDEFEELTELLRKDNLYMQMVLAIQDQARSLADEIYSDLEKEYEYRTSDEAVAEMIRANEYEFDAEGNLV
jgi:hypothetical protein